MKYKTTGTRAGLKFNVRKRVTKFDSKSNLKSSSYGEFEDHKEMKTYEFAEFQKNIFKERAKQKRRRILIFAVSAVIIIIILSLMPALVNAIFEAR